MGRQEVFIPCTVLKKLYTDNKLSAYSIADVYGCYPSCIYGKLKKCNIKTRSLSKAETIRVTRFKNDHPKRFSKNQRKANKHSNKIQSKRNRFRRYTITCDLCNRTKKVRLSDIKRNKSGYFFCSRKHVMIFWNKNRNVKRKSNRKNLRMWKQFNRDVT